MIIQSLKKNSLKVECFLQKHNYISFLPVLYIKRRKKRNKITCAIFDNDGIKRWFDMFQRASWLAVLTMQMFTWNQNFFNQKQILQSFAKCVSGYFVFDRSVQIFVCQRSRQNALVDPYVCQQQTAHWSKTSVSA